MVSFKQFLNEQSSINVLTFEKALYYIRTSGCPVESSYPIYRGLTGVDKDHDAILFRARSQRPSRDSNAVFNDMFNAAYYRQTGVKDARQQMFFGTNSLSLAHDYGTVYFCFPLGKVSFATQPSKDSWLKFVDECYYSMREAFLEAEHDRSLNTDAVKDVRNEVQSNGMASTVINMVWETDGEKSLSGLSDAAVAALKKKLISQTVIDTHGEETVDVIIKKVFSRAMKMLNSKVLQTEFTITDTFSGSSKMEIMMISDFGHICINVVAAAREWARANGIDSENTFPFNVNNVAVYSWIARGGKD